MLFFYPIWSLLDLPLEKALEKIKSAGYDGAELAIDPYKTNLDDLQQCFQKHDLLLLAQHPFAKGNSFLEYEKDYSDKLNLIAQMDTVYINCHTGTDYFSFEENLALLTVSQDIAAQSGTLIGHEIHRGRFSFHPKICAAYLETKPDLVLTADFSHWCVVTESLLAPFRKEVQAAINCTAHIHCRVGSDETPQVNDPFAPEHKEALQQHLIWWKEAYSKNREKQQSLLITCEFGPPPYQQCLPYSEMPVSDIWEINKKMKNYLKKELV
ncbi:MAG: sugar phosphate isomerase/epimerase [Bacteroidota bacterium]